ncbi:MAG: PmeII family type II restriction endonuclease [Gallionella sp.]|nr:PmeII family type II restriction endonuclease [Gallionella sp.]
MKDKIAAYIEQKIPEFHKRRLESLTGLDLDKVLMRKNPYLFKAKNINSAGGLVKAILDAHLSSQEETIFGAFLENVAIYACSITQGGIKSGIEGIDLEFTQNEARYIVSIKSGPNWGNSSQIKKMQDNFKKAKIVLRQNGTIKNVIAVNGCCYGRDNSPDKGDYFKYCGENFWTLVSGDSHLYLDLIEPLGHKARQRNDEFDVEYGKANTRFTKSFIEKYCVDDGSINWDKIVRLNSAAKKLDKEKIL